MLEVWRHAVLVAAVLATGAVAKADTVTVAVASNFSVPLAELAADFERDSGHTLRLVTGSTGRLYAQIVNGAPYDVFLAADVERPARLESDAMTVPGSRFTYAEGVLVLWSADPAISDCLAALKSLGRRRLSIANPRIAPYGRAARAFLESLGVWDAVQPSLVTGESVAQAAQFVASRNAELGLIARSQIQAGLGEPACSFEVPANSHPPIDQQAVWLQRSADSGAAGEFVMWLKSVPVRDRLAKLGYRTRATSP